MVSISDLPTCEGKTGWPWTEGSPRLPITMPDGSPWPRISIVTPSYNQGQFIEETIRSVLLQGYPNLEYIIIDGGSTDASVEIIKKYEPWLAHWVSDPDRGQSHAINKGFARATGDLVAWLNSDDLYVSDVLGRISKIWHEQKGIGFIHGVCEFIDFEGKKTGKFFGAQFNLIQTLETCRNVVAQPSTFINHLALNEVGLVDESMSMSMDWDLWLRLGSRYPALFCPEVYSFFRLWPNAKSSTILHRSGADHLKSVKKLFANGQTNGLDKKVVRRAIGIAYGRDALINYLSHNMMRFRYSFIRSFIFAPELRGGMARNLIRQFCVGDTLLSYMSSVKKLAYKTYKRIGGPCR